MLRQMKGLFRTTRIFAFRSFANIVCLYRACLDEGVRECRELVEEGIESRLAYLGPMSKNLERSSYLSPSGRGFFEPFREELFP